MNGTPDLSWSLTWESEVPEHVHAGLAALFARCYPRSRTGFTGTRSWAQGRPELRLVGQAGAEPVAHAGFLRRFLRVPGRDASLLVADVGLVAVAPSHQGRGTGAELMRRVTGVLHGLGVPFGYLTCGEQVAGFYERAGWVRASGGTRAVRADGRVQVYGGVSMLLPVRGALDDWPAGCLVDRNGFEV